MVDFSIQESAVESDVNTSLTLALVAALLYVGIRAQRKDTPFWPKNWLHRILVVCLFLGAAIWIGNLMGAWR